MSLICTKVIIYWIKLCQDLRVFNFKILTYLWLFFFGYIFLWLLCLTFLITWTESVVKSTQVINAISIEQADSWGRKGNEKFKGLVPLEFKWDITTTKKGGTADLPYLSGNWLVVFCSISHHVSLSSFASCVFVGSDIAYLPKSVTCNLYIFFNLLIKRARLYFVGYELFLSSYYVIKLIFYPKDLTMWSLFSFSFIFIFIKDFHIKFLLLF